MRASAIVLAMLAMARPAAAETVQLYAAGMPEKLAVGAEYGLTVIKAGRRQLNALRISSCHPRPRRF
jgi:hypothetical protein